MIFLVVSGLPLEFFFKGCPFFCICCIYSHTFRGGAVLCNVAFLVAIEAFPFEGTTRVGHISLWPRIGARVPLTVDFVSSHTSIHCNGGVIKVMWGVG